MPTASCPECGTALDLEEPPQQGDWIVCSHCQANLEVINLEPLELDWVYNEPLEVWGKIGVERGYERW